ncbi:glycogen debranching enzyme [Pseudovirgaria hyperparasitica]|uniref:Glycogen debranching enzyme n=1 Tax=Pseudovirgaria hyperparasitica TaxID=470096 RepID=A0A6A6W8T0_9PEZI|nr:glycogen debranching enzyme [Pseudovirgaria hyperparasitica]KAF2757987.1 glycogen debranching enzyme [Pseudovirgaria hyperparasitica]
MAYRCVNNQLVYPTTSTTDSPNPTGTPILPNGGVECIEEPTRLHLSDGPYENYFYGDCHSSSHVVVTSPLDDSNLTFISPRLLVAWASGNSGLLAFFQPQDGVNGSLTIQLEEMPSGNTIEGVYESGSSRNPVVGVAGYVRLNSSAVLTIPILGSIRTMRDFTEGPSLLYPIIQDALIIEEIANSGVSISRTWLDNVTTTQLSFTPVGDAGIKTDNGTLFFESGTYQFNATFDYPQLERISPDAVLNPSSYALLSQATDQAVSLSFLSYTDKLLAGTWRFLTYFGRDTMIAMLLLQPVLSEGKDSAVEAVIGAVLERVNSTDGSVCHEETIGDYATYLNIQNNITSTDPQYDYKMIDTDYFLPITMEYYFLRSPIGRARMADFLETKATVDPNNAGMSYRDLALVTAERIMDLTAAFAQPGGQTRDNLIRLKEDQIVGQWRDSTYGIGGGRIPYDVNTALVPAALRSLSQLSTAGFFPEHPEWSTLASRYADIWEESTLDFFSITINTEEAASLVSDYVTDNQFSFPSQAETLTSPINFYALALEGNNNQDLVRVMNTDDCFRLFLLNSTNQAQLTAFMDQVSTHILAPYPVGLSTDAGLLVANPAFGGDPVYSTNFTNSAYHGTVIWSWQLAMMAAGLERQLDRCNSDSQPEFCANEMLHVKIMDAYNHLWDLIEDNEDQLSGEVWGWTYTDGRFETTPLGSLPPPPDGTRPESNIRQLWSLTFLAVRRNSEFSGTRR